MRKVEIYTDGSCLDNPGPGGWCAILRIAEKNYEKIFSGGAKSTTNNFMELYAVVRGVEQLKKPCEITVYSDSKYVCDAFNQSWIENWKKHGWVTSQNKKVANLELWQFLLEIIEKGQHNIHFVWVKGHAENDINNRCDEIAHQEAIKAKNTPDDDCDFELIA